MSPLIIALFSVRGVERRYRAKNGGICNYDHKCRPNCGRQSGWCCDWVRMMDRPC